MPLLSPLMRSMVQKDRAREFMQKRFLPLLQGKVKYHAEVVHFATDADSIGEVSCLHEFGRPSRRPGS